MKRRTPKPAVLAAAREFQAPSGKLPRQWAAEIYALPTKLARNAALEMVPGDIRVMVRKYVEIWFSRNKPMNGTANANLSNSYRANIDSTEVPATHVQGTE